MVSLFFVLLGIGLASASGSDYSDYSRGILAVVKFSDLFLLFLLLLLLFSFFCVLYHRSHSWTNPNDMSTHHPPAICPRGSYCSKVDLIEVKCAKGKYNQNRGMSEESSCENCFDGFYNPILGQQTCPFQCGPGRYGNHQGQPPIDASFCKSCPKGTYCAGQGTVVPSACPAGRWSSTEQIDSVSQCNLCRENSYSSSTGLDAAGKCTSCPSGRFSIAGSTTMQSCTTTGFECTTDGGTVPMYGK